MTTGDHFISTTSAPPSHQAERIKPILSLNGDVFLHRRCSRQYGLVKVRGYADTSDSHVFIGELIHNTMEDAAKHFAVTSTAMSDAEFAALLAAHYAELIGKGASPKAPQAVKIAGLKLMVLYRTMDVLGVLSNIESAEQMLTKTESDYIFQGRVDAVRTSSGNVELWDYKSGSDPRDLVKGVKGAALKAIWQRHLDDQALQLRLYHDLYEATYGKPPAGCRLVYIGSVPCTLPSMTTINGTSPKDLWASFTPTPLTSTEWAAEEATSGLTGSGMFLDVPITPTDIAAALQELNTTAAAIVSQRETDAWPAPALADAPDEEKTCSTCAVRSTCSVPRDRGHLP